MSDLSHFTWVDHSVDLQRPFVVHLKGIHVPDTHIPSNRRHLRPIPSIRMSGGTRVLGGLISPQRSKVTLFGGVNGATINAGWHWSGRAATSDVCRPAAEV